MACILHIETSTTLCSVAVSEDSQVIYHEERGKDVEGKRYSGSASEHIGSMVADALSFADSHAIPVDAVAVSQGPGSYTGLRIGVSMAKGLCYGRGLKLIAVPTLELIAVPVLLRDPDMDPATLICPMIDARRMEVYAAVYDRALKPLRDVQADVVTTDTYSEWLERGPVIFCGDGAAKCKEVITHPNARFIDGIVPEARYMQPLAERRLLTDRTEDVAYFTPFYLKDFVAKQSKPLL